MDVLYPKIENTYMKFAQNLSRRANLLLSDNATFWGGITLLTFQGHPLYLVPYRSVAYTLKSAFQCINIVLLYYFNEKRLHVHGLMV